MFSSQLDGGFTSSQSQSTQTLYSGSNKRRFVQPVLPLTVKQISEAYNSTDDKSILVIDGVEATNVKLLRLVMSKEEMSTNVTKSFAEGTGATTPTRGNLFHNLTTRSPPPKRFTKYSTFGTLNSPLHFAVDLVEAKMLIEFNLCLSKYSTFNGPNSPSTSLSPPRATARFTRKCFSHDFRLSLCNKFDRCSEHSYEFCCLWTESQVLPVTMYSVLNEPLIVKVTQAQKISNDWMRK